MRSIHSFKLEEFLNVQTKKLMLEQRCSNLKSLHVLSLGIRINGSCILVFFKDLDMMKNDLCVVGCWYATRALCPSA
jgi:hypothetical protein